MITSVDIPRTYNVVTDLLDVHVKEGRGNKIAIFYEDQKISYQQVLEQVNRTGNALQGLGVEMESRVLLLLPDCPEFVYSFLGAIKIGAVPIPTNTLLTPEDYLYIINDSRARVVIVSEDLLSQIGHKKDQFKYVKHIVVVGTEQKEYMNYNELVAESSSQLEAAETCKDDVAFWLYSSGSTGPPKGTVHLHHDMIYCADLYARNILNIGPEDICFSVAKLFFAYGLGNGLYFPFRVGGSTVLFSGRPLPENIFNVVQKYRPTIFFGVPTAYNNMLQIPEAEKKYDFSSVRLCTSAGEALPAVIYKQWLELFNVEILDGIGSTEVLHIFISNRSGQIKPGSTGLPVPGYELRIVNEYGKEVPDGEPGILLVKGESNAACYWNKHEKTKQTMLGEWLNTNDRYYKDQDGFYWYVGRDDDMLKVGGIWVSPVEVENTLLEHPSVFEAAVVGVHDSEGLVKTKAFVTLREKYQPSTELEEELKQFVKNKIAPYKYPRQIKFVDELPKTATGKLQRFRLRQMEEQQV